MTTTRSISRERKNKTNVIIFEQYNELFPLLKKEIIKQNSLCAENYNGKQPPYNKERITINEFNNNVCEFDNEKAPIQIK